MYERYKLKQVTDLSRNPKKDKDSIKRIGSTYEKISVFKGYNGMFNYVLDKNDEVKQGVLVTSTIQHIVTCKVENTLPSRL